MTYYDVVVIKAHILHYTHLANYTTIKSVTIILILIFFV